MELHVRPERGAKELAERRCVRRHLHLEVVRVVRGRPRRGVPRHLQRVRTRRARSPVGGVGGADKNEGLSGLFIARKHAPNIEAAAIGAATEPTTRAAAIIQPRMSDACVRSWNTFSRISAAHQALAGRRHAYPACSTEPLARARPSQRSPRSRRSLDYPPLNATDSRTSSMSISLASRARAPPLGALPTLSTA